MIETLSCSSRVPIFADHVPEDMSLMLLCDLSTVGATLPAPPFELSLRAAWTRTIHNPLHPPFCIACMVLHDLATRLDRSAALRAR